MRVKAHYLVEVAAPIPQHIEDENERLRGRFVGLTARMGRHPTLIGLGPDSRLSSLIQSVYQFFRRDMEAKG